MQPLVGSSRRSEETEADLAGLSAEQVLDGALMSAGLLEGPHDVITRINKLMEKALG